MATTEQTYRKSAQQARWRGRQSPQLTGLSQVTRRLLGGAPPVAAPMISRAGVHGEAHRVRSTLRATMQDQQLIGGK